MGIGRDARIGGKEARVGIHECGGGVVIAGADVCVATHSSVPGAADDKCELGVGLETHQPGDDVDPVSLEIASPADIPRLFKARFELHVDRYVLPGRRRAAQGFGERGRLAQTIERELDCLDGWIVRGFRDEPFDGGRKRIVRMVHEHVVLIELRGDRPVRRKGIDRGQRRIVRQSAICGDLEQATQIDGTIGDVDVSRIERAVALALFESKLSLQQVP